MLGVLLLATALRFYRLDAQSLWNDEGTSIALAQRNLATITRNAANDIHPPLYYYLLHVWVGLAGTGEYAVRALSALQGVALVAVTYALGRRLLSRYAGLLGALLAALSPFGVYYAQETRMYAQVSLFGALSMLAYARLLDAWADERPARDRLAAAGLYVLAAALAVYSHYFAFTLILAQNLGFVLWLARHVRGRPISQARRPLMGWAGAQLGILLAYVPWLLLSWRSLTAWPAISEPFSLARLLRDVVTTFVFGPALEPGPNGVWLALALAALVVPGVLGRVRRSVDSDAQPQAAPRAGAMDVALYMLVPVAVLYALSLRRPMYNLKFVLLATPAFYLLQAQGVVVLGHWLGGVVRRPLAGVALALPLTLTMTGASVLGLHAVYTDPAHFRDNYRGIVAYIEATARPDDAILINAPSQIETVDYYYRGAWPQYPLPLERPMDTVRAQQQLEEIASRHRRLYGIFWATNESDPEGFIEGWLDRNCYKAMDRWYGNIRLVVYAVPQTTSGEMAQPLDASLDGGDGVRIRLLGYSVLTPDAQAGDILQIALFWQADEPVTERYKVFVHVVDGQGQMVGQRDSEPGGGGRLTTLWEPGEIIVDNYGVLIPPDTPPGEHVVRVGMYGMEDGGRLPVSLDGTPIGDYVDIVGVQVRQAP
jgi:hypothetical protein